MLKECVVGQDDEVSSAARELDSVLSRIADLKRAIKKDGSGAHIPWLGSGRQLFRGL
tara:strand:+ start:1092 stop:1262 length:171 start_codon:yes stop_codon:yes gene_type:complete